MDKLKGELSKYPCMAIKQSYTIFEDLVDVHVYNCANLKRYEYKGILRPLVVEASTTPQPLGPCDLKFFIQERNFTKSVSLLHNFDDWTLDKSTNLRPYGPGIMTEIVIYLIEHLGFAEVVTVGWDNKIVGKEVNQEQHFYTQGPLKEQKFIDQNDTLSIVPAKEIKEEEKISCEGVASWNKWLKGKGCTLKICSAINPVDKSIERVKI